MSEGSWLRRIDRSGVPLLLARLVLAFMFITMGVKKLDYPPEFLKQVRLYHMLPEEPPIFLNSTAIVLPWLEIICGVALLIGLRVRGAAVCILIMLCVFTPAILARTLQIQAETGESFFKIAFDCGCGAGVVNAAEKLRDNIGLVLLAVVALISQSKRFCLQTLLERRSTSAF